MFLKIIYTLFLAFGCLGLFSYAAFSFNVRNELLLIMLMLLGAMVYHSKRDA
ncbi:hypothetical protein GGR60_000545 [Xanthomonas arboricola]|nr:hypothetical protein [Xanthomonas euroxanthea]